VADFVGTKHFADRTAGSIIEALSDPTRRQIVSLLSHGPRRAGELAAEVGMSAPAVSRHLRVLLSAEVIADERIEQDARARIFRVRPEAIKTARDWLDSVLSDTVLSDTALSNTGSLKVNGYE